ncbi:hypothetical protein [Pleionea sp. CnH1-48]|uniref:hypothetical protein n=1 Tax=Pleionea sp. CnH1-48 TaxID=2954494 RepID=UPI002097385C|nr:hypothetical protein [Pleionea sp. CnH1-48]MCO7224896.1 hypothetical protein [Pleionea sp. CnH1-48]
MKLMKLSLLTLSCLSVWATANDTNYILAKNTLEVETIAKGDKPPRKKEERIYEGPALSGIPILDDMAVGIDAIDGLMATSVDVSTTMFFGGVYTGNLVATCNADVTTPEPELGLLFCRQSTTFFLDVGNRNGRLDVSVAKGSSHLNSTEASPSSLVCFNIDCHGNPEEPIEFDVTPYETGTLTLSSQFYTSGIIPAQSAVGQFVFVWDYYMDAYRFNADDKSDHLIDANTLLDNGNNHYHMVGAKKWTSGFLPVDIAKKYRLRGDFKSVDENESFIYFGFESYDENHELIRSIMVNRAGNDGVVSSFNATSIQTDNALQGWAPLHQSNLYRGIGIYPDGDTSKRPKHIIDPTQGNHYQTLGNNQVDLAAALPAEVMNDIIPGVTVIKNHQASSAHIYIAGQHVGNQWTHFEQDFEGALWYNNHHSFRPETKYVKVYVAGNWINSENAELLFDNLVLETIEQE